VQIKEGDMPTVIIPAMRDNTTIARVAAMDSGGTMTKLDSGEVAVTAPRRLFLSRRGIESALGYPMRHSAWRNLRQQAQDGIVTLADDMTLIVEIDAPRTDRPSEPDGQTVATYTVQRYRTKAPQAADSRTAE
jgi:hypothetical protein